MPQSNRKKKKKKKNNANAQRKKSQSRRRTPKPRIDTLAEIMLDPCSSVLRPGLNATDEGILARSQTSYTNVGAHTGGYMVWFPDYVASTLAAVGNPHYRHGNCFFYQNSDTAAQPINSVANPYGDASNTPGVDSIAVGASTFCTSSTVADFRHVTSCLKMLYTGAMSDAKGVFTPLENISADVLLYGGVSGNPPSIDDIFALSTRIQRIGVGSHEIRSRPTAMNELFRPAGDSVMNVGIPGTGRTYLAEEEHVQSPNAIGFAWKGVPGDQLFFSFVQNVEWRPDAHAGIANVVPRQLKDPGFAMKLAAQLGKLYPGWTTAARDTANHYAYNVARTAFTGLLSGNNRLLM